jgi:hypothetical protein
VFAPVWLRTRMPLLLFATVAVRHWGSCGGEEQRVDPRQNRCLRGIGAGKAELDIDPRSNGRGRGQGNVKARHPAGRDIDWRVCTSAWNRLIGEGRRQLADRCDCALRSGGGSAVDERGRSGRWAPDLNRLARRHNRGDQRGQCRRGGDPPDLVAGELCEPQRAIRPGGNAERSARCGRNSKFGDRAARCNPPDIVSALLGESQRAVRPRDDAVRAAGRCRDHKFSDRAGGGNAPNIVAVDRGEPQRAIWASREVPAGRLFNAVGRGNSVIAPPVVMRPILLPSFSANHSAPSGPAAMPIGELDAVWIGNSVIVPLVVIRPMLFPLSSVNHSAPSGPAVTTIGRLDAVGTRNSEIVPPVVIRPILLPRYSVNHSAPSGPAATMIGELDTVGTGNSVMVWAPTGDAVPRAAAKTAKSALLSLPSISIPRLMRDQRVNEAQRAAALAEQPAKPSPGRSKLPR